MCGSHSLSAVLQPRWASQMGRGNKARKPFWWQCRNLQNLDIRQLVEEDAKGSVSSSGPWAELWAMSSDRIAEPCKPGSDACGLGRKKKRIAEGQKLSVRAFSWSNGCHFEKSEWSYIFSYNPFVVTGFSLGAVAQSEVSRVWALCSPRGQELAEQRFLRVSSLAWRTNAVCLWGLGSAERKMDMFWDLGPGAILSFTPTSQKK